jgi:CIC family chloride channel protein
MFLSSNVEYKKRFQEWLSKFAFPNYTIFSIFAIIMGAVAGLAAVLFHDAVELLNEILFSNSIENLFFIGSAIVIFIPAVGMLIQAIMIIFSPNTAKQKGVSEVIKAVAIRGGYIPFKTTLFHFIAPAVCIGTGGTVGPEGPAAQLGGGLASKLSDIWGLSDSRKRIFTAAGAGAAIAAIFNTPLGGIFFALEIILLNDFQTPTFSALILASVTASAISRILLGNESIFHFQHHAFTDYSQLWIFIVLGVFAGIISLLFIKYSTFLSHLFNRKILKIIPQWLAMTIVGILIGVAGYFYRDILGIGYSAINEMLSNSLSWKLVLLLMVLKFLFVPLILHSGGFGGLFAPSLFIGAAAGYLFAYFFKSIGLTTDFTIIILVSMGAVLGGINTIPISAILIIFEMSKDYSFILPLMLAVIVSTTIVQLTIKGSIHIKHLEEQGFKIVYGRETNILKKLKVSDVPLKDIELIDEKTTLPQIVRKLIASSHDTFYVNNEEGKIIGTITESELRPIMIDYDTLKNVVVARDVMKPLVITVNYNDDLDYVLRLLSKYNLDQFPVVRDNVIIGSILRRDLLEVYNRESLKENLADGLSHELSTIDEAGTSRIAGYIIREIPVLDSLAGKTLASLRIRNRYGIEILLIKKKKNLFSEENGDEIIAPDPNLALNLGDTLVVFGEESKIRQFENEI